MNKSFKKIKLMSLALCTAFLLTSCGTKGTGSTVKSKADGKETIMVYMVASDLESKGALASTDLLEMVESKYNKDNLEVLVCTGGTNKWWVEEIPTDKSMVYKVTDESIEPVYTMNGKNMADPETLTEFLDYGYENHKADYYGLVLWNHGGGAVLGYGADQNYNNDALSMTELSSSFSKSKLCEKDKFEWIGFDACLMGMIEVADMLEPYANYMIASEEVEAGEGWDYSFLADISDNKKFNGEDTGKAIIDSYSEYFSKVSEYKPDYTLSCLNLSETQNVIDSLDKFVSAAEEELKNGGYSKIARLRGQTKTFGRVSNTSFYDSVDIYNLAEQMEGLYPSESSELKSSLEKMITHNKSNVSSANGLAIYFPYENKDYAESWLKEYDSFEFSKTYSKFINNFTTTLSGGSLTTWDVAQAIPKPENDAPAAGEKQSYFVQLSENEIKNFDKSLFTIWQKDSEGVYISWLTSSDVTLSEDGKLRSTFDGRKFYIGDTSGNSKLCTAIEIERTKEYAKYAVPVAITRTENFDFEIAYMHIKVDDANPNGYIAGIYDSMDTEESLFPNKNTVKIEEGNEIRPFYFARDIKFNANGSVGPFDSWGSASGVGDSFVVKGKVTIDSKAADESSEYVALFKIVDTQGNVYYSNPIYINK